MTNGIATAYASETNTTEQTQDEGVLASLGINGSLFAFQLVNFVIVAGIIWLLILKPISRKLAERQQIIEDSLTNAERVKKNLEESERKFQERIDEAKVEANKIAERSVVEAHEAGSQLREKAKQEIERLVEQAKKNIKIEREEMVKEIKKEVSVLVIAVAEKILAEKIDGQKDQKLIEEFAEKLIK